MVIDQPGNVTDWGDIISPNGLRIAPTVIPLQTMALDQQIGGNALGANSLNGIINSSIGVGASKQGGGFISLDGPNKRLLVNDGLNDRILVGYQPGAF